MKKSILYLSVFLFLASCGNEIKNDENKVVVEPGAEVVDTTLESSSSNKKFTTETIDTAALVEPEIARPESEMKDLLGYWVGDFINAEEDYSKNIYVDDAFMWSRNNKINISLDYIKDGKVEGHSVVAGNDRPFTGTMTLSERGYEITAKEPGDDKYDGEFKFTIEQDALHGTWTAYKEIEIKNRKYNLTKKEYAYDPDINLEYSLYVNWNKSKEVKETYEYDDDEVEEWITTQFETSTEKIYELNASNTLLTKEVVENLKRADILIIRNTIYARHGYSFKNRPLRVFFDSQSWYIPVHTDITTEFTDIEKANITLLLKYEENASKYYDSFGRG
jgi:hypothetical protein